MLPPRMRFIKRKRNGEAVTECNRIDLRRETKVTEARGLVGRRSAVVDGGGIIDVCGWISLFITVCEAVASTCDARVDWPRNFEADIAKGLRPANAVFVVNAVREGRRKLLCCNEINIRDTWSVATSRDIQN